MKRRSGSVLIGVLWCVSLLSVVVIGVLHSTKLELRVSKNHGDQIQAYYLAIAGVEKAKALIYNEAKERSGSATHHSGKLFNAPQEFRDVRFGRGLFRVFHQSGEGGRMTYGVQDEESRLNVNLASEAELMKLPRMTADVAAAILDWRDRNDSVSPNGGAEAEYYASVRPAYQPRNDKLLSIRELLMVRGVASEKLFGEDANQNGLLDPSENDGSATFPPDNEDGLLDAGWAGHLTVQSAARNITADGRDRLNVQTADETALTGVAGITTDIARAIVSSRGNDQLESLADLLDVTAPTPQNQRSRSSSNQSGNRSERPSPAEGQSSRSTSQQTSSQSTSRSGSGPKVISKNFLIDIADELTTATGVELPGAVNVNTASSTVLECLPGMNPELAQAVVNYRSSAGFFKNIAQLLNVDGITQQTFEDLAPRVTVRSETFRVLSEGIVQSTGARRRIEVVFRIGASSVDTLAYREDL